MFARVKNLSLYILYAHYVFMGIYLKREDGFSQDELELARRTMLRERDFYLYHKRNARKTRDDPYVFRRHVDNASIQLDTTQIQLDPKVANHPAVYKLIKLLNPTHYLRDGDVSKTHELAELWGSNET